MKKGRRIGSKNKGPKLNQSVQTSVTEAVGRLLAKVAAHKQLSIAAIARLALNEYVEKEKL